MADGQPKRRKPKWHIVLIVVLAAVAGALADTGVLGELPAVVLGQVADAALPPQT